jgi:hypothetical protein
MASLVSDVDYLVNRAQDIPYTIAFGKISPSRFAFFTFLRNVSEAFQLFDTYNVKSDETGL